MADVDSTGYPCKRCGHGSFLHLLGDAGRYPCTADGCSCPMLVGPRDTFWRIVVAPIDETDMVGILELSSAYEHVYFEPAGGVVVESNPTGFGSFRDLRLIPWSRLLDFEKIGPI